MNLIIYICTATMGLTLLLFARLIYRTAYPKRLTDFPSGAGEARHPKDLSWPCLDLELVGCQGNVIRGWIVPADEPNAVILLLHGHRKNKVQMLGRARFLRPKGYTLVFIDHRHHGASDDAPFGLGYFGRLDLAKVVEHLRKREELKNIPIGALGLSLGATTAIAAALDGVDLAAVVADSPTSNQAKTLAEYGKRLYCFPESITMFGLNIAQWWWQMDYQKMHLEKRMGQCQIPILIIHGDEDQRVPIHHAKRLAAVETKVPIQLEVFTEANHVEAYTKARKRYERLVLEFFGKTLQSS